MAHERSNGRQLAEGRRRSGLTEGTTANPLAVTVAGVRPSAGQKSAGSGEIASTANVVAGGDRGHDG